MMLRRTNFKSLFILLSLCVSVAVPQHVSRETANPCPSLVTKRRFSYKKRPTSSNEGFKRRSRGGLIWDPCEQDSDCLSPRTCRKLLKSGNSRACNSRPDCLCDITIDLAFTCIHDSECHRGEFCYRVFQDAAGNCFSKRASQFKYLHPRRKKRRGKRGKRGKRRLSKATPPEDNTVADNSTAKYTVTPTVSSQGLGIKSERDNVTSQESRPEGGKFCIGINSLTHLSREELKFAEDVEAKVVCDDFNSCATRGHVVIVNGRGMMMSSYCKQTKCYEHVKLVNSPKEAKYVRIKSKTDGLVFTGYSARYGTKVEETMFRILTSLGL